MATPADNRRKIIAYNDLDTLAFEDSFIWFGSSFIYCTILLFHFLTKKQKNKTKHDKIKKTFEKWLKEKLFIYTFSEDLRQPLTIDQLFIIAT